MNLLKFIDRYTLLNLQMKIFSFFLFIEKGIIFL